MNFNLSQLKTCRSLVSRLHAWIMHNLVLYIVLLNMLTLGVSLMTMYKVNSFIASLNPTTVIQPASPLEEQPQPAAPEIKTEPLQETPAIEAPAPKRIHTDMQKIKEIINNLNRTALIAHTAFTREVEYAQRQLIGERLQTGRDLLSEIHPALSLDALHRMLCALQGRFTQSNFSYPFKHPVIMRNLPRVIHAINLTPADYQPAIQMILESGIPEQLKHDMIAALKDKGQI